MNAPQIFLSYAGEDVFEAGLLQRCIERLFGDLNVHVWTYNRDQVGDERTVGRSLRERVRESSAVIMLVSQFTLTLGITQWMELAYADAFNIPTFVLLHHINFEDLKHSERGIPPLLLEGQCTPAVDWLSLEEDLRRHCCHNNDLINPAGGAPEDYVDGTSERGGKS